MEPPFRGGSNEPTTNNSHFLTEKTAILPKINAKARRGVNRLPTFFRATTTL